MKIRTAITNNVLNPYDDYDDLVKLIIFLCVSSFLLRGGKELSYLLWEFFSVGIYQDRSDMGMHYI